MDFGAENNMKKLYPYASCNNKSRASIGDGEAISLEMGKFSNARLICAADRLFGCYCDAVHFLRWHVLFC